MGNLGKYEKVFFKFSGKNFWNTKDGQWTKKILSECIYQPKRCCICMFLEPNKAVHSPRSDSQDWVLILLGLIPQRPVQRLLHVTD